MFPCVYHRFHANLKRSLGGITNVETCTKRRHIESESIDVLTAECHSLLPEAGSSLTVNPQSQLSSSLCETTSLLTFTSQSSPDCSQLSNLSEDTSSVNTLLQPVAQARLDKLHSSLPKLAESSKVRDRRSQLSSSLCETTSLLTFTSQSSPDCSQLSNLSEDTSSVNTLLQPVAQARLDKLCSSLLDLKLAMSDCAIEFGSFTYVKSNTLLTFVQLSDDVNSTVELCLVIDENFAIRVHVLGKELSNVHTVFSELPTVVNSVGSVAAVLRFFSGCFVCQAVDYSALPNSNVMSRLSGTCIDTYNRLRSSSCHLLLRCELLCPSCRLLKKRVSMINARQRKKIVVTDIMRCRQPNQSLTSPMKLQKLRQLARERKLLNRTIFSLKDQLQLSRNKCSALIEKNAVKLNESDSAEMVTLVKECEESVLKQFPEDSFQRIFWEQQIQYNKLKKKSSMRWHPTMIRWCLFMKSKSAAAYDGMRSYLCLPSERTLYDYSHYMENGLGVNPRTVEQLIVTAKQLGCFDEEHKSFVGILQDEVKVQTDLVYHKHTGQLMGYVNLDAVSNELLELQNVTTGDRQLAKSLLVVMVRGITTNLSYPFAAYATNCLSASMLYTVMWECTEYIEVVAGLKLLFICCDGAVQNRQFFKLMADSDEAVYKTANPYDTDREIYFVCDPPHLLKTARNCFSNSGAHTNSRQMWYNQTISWKHVVQLYDDCCMKSEYRLCPKLTRDHLYLTAFSRMKVSLAAQVLSSTVANALDHVYGETCKSTVEFIRIINKWFDIVNVKDLFEARNARNPDVAPFTDVNDPRLKWLEHDFLEYLNNWKTAVDNRPGNFTGQQKNKMILSVQTILGFKITCQAIPEIVRIVLAAGAPFVLTNHLNQDPLEQLFGHCRHKGGSNSNPNTAEACNAINTIRTVSTQAVAKKTGNTKECPSQLDFSSVPKRR
jgi:DNA transposase THAP9